MADQDNPHARATLLGRPTGWTLIAALVALVMGLAGGAAGAAFGFGSGAWHEGGLMGGPLDPVSVDRRVERMMKHLAIEADANPEQQAKLVSIARRAASELLPVADTARANRKRAIDLLTAASIDRAAIEQLRSEEIGLAEAASKRLAQALTEAAEVLTPEQRRTLAERISAWHWGRWHHG
jgi:periplasmic protein CpxP/Spy